MTTRHLAELVIEDVRENNLSIEKVLAEMLAVAKHEASIAKRYPDDYSDEEQDRIQETLEYLEYLRVRSGWEAWPTGVQCKILWGTPEHYEETLWHPILARAVSAVHRILRDAAAEQGGDAA